jgi:hypothetical protein
MDGVVYYFSITDIDKNCKIDVYFYYIYGKETGWQSDDEHILSDRLIGYDGDVIGSSDMLSNAEEITEEEANKLIAAM